jgi:hypothetical protein
MFKERTLTYMITVCDFCQKEQRFADDIHLAYQERFDRCALCGKHCCGPCAGDGGEDGLLCPDCSKTHYYSSGNGVSIKNKKTKKSVKAEWL